VKVQRSEDISWLLSPETLVKGKTGHKPGYEPYYEHPVTSHESRDVAIYDCIPSNSVLYTEWLGNQHLFLQNEPTVMVGTAW
jgi:hypothetical protein